MTKKVYLSALPYCLWLFLFVLALIALLVYKSFFDIHNQLTLANYVTYFTSLTYLKMSLNSVIYATIISFVTLVVSYPAAYFLTKLKHKQLWLMLIILPTWINLLLKAYAFTHQCWTRGDHQARPSSDQRPEPQLPRPQRSRADVPG